MNEIRNFVTFIAEFPDDAAWNEKGDLLVPGGRAITEELGNLLRTHGCTVTTVEQHSFYGWTFDVVDEQRAAFILAQAENEWLVILSPRQTLWSRLTGRDYETPLKILARVHESLKLDKRFSNIRWHTRRDYEGGKGDRASSAP
jgi:hypothetical protein